MHVDVNYAFLSVSEAYNLGTLVRAQGREGKEKEGNVSFIEELWS